MTTTEETIAAAYIRMSTSKQEDSPERQKKQINDYAAKNGYTIVRWYSDFGMTGTESKKRAGYQQLLGDLPLGAFQAVLLAEQSRMSREDIFEVIPQWDLFRKAGVKLVSCSRGEIDFDSMGGLLTAFIDQYSSNDESKKIADRTVSGKNLATERGIRFAGLRILGYDRKIVDNAGSVMKIVNFRESFQTSPDCRAILVPSADTNTVEAIQWAFQFVADGGSIFSVKREFDKRGIKSVRNNKLTITTIRQMLETVTYTGMTVLGGQANGKFNRLKPAVLENSHEAIVSRELFEKANEQISSRNYTQEKWHVYLLTRLCKCGNCGKSLNGVAACRHAGRRYCCRNKACNQHVTILCRHVEEAVVKVWSEAFLSDSGVDEIRAAKKGTGDSSDDRLAELGAQINRTAKNLALAESSDDFQAVSKILRDLRKEEADLRKQLTRDGRRGAMAGVNVTQLKKSRKKLADLEKLSVDEKQMLMAALQKTIDRVVITTVKTGIHLRHTAVVHFNPEHCSVGAVELPDEEVYKARPHRVRLLPFLAERHYPIEAKAIAKALRVPKPRVNNWLRLCRAEGFVKMTDEGYVLVKKDENA